MPAKPHPTHCRIALPLTIAALGLIALPLAGCGGSSGPASTATAPTHTQAARLTPRASNADVGSAGAQRTAPRTGSSRHGPHARGHTQAVAGSVGPAGRVQKARPSGTTEIDENPGQPKPLNPCKLVSRSEAQSIVGRSIAASVEAPLGPTCIYQLSGSKSQITLEVERLSYGQATHQLSKRTRVNVGDREALCGSLGTEMLFVPLASGQVLHVTAPCTVAQRFATLALKRLAA